MSSGLKNKNHIIRKAYDWSGKIPRLMKLRSSKKKDYSLNSPVLINSFPKSGTHLLFQILEIIPNLKSYGTFLASTPSIPHRKRSKAKICREINRTVPGELLRSHLFYDNVYVEALRNKNVVHYFIYRDPRDVAISEAFFLTYNYRWHSIHRYYRALRSDNERIAFSILGVKGASFPFYYPNIAKRFQNYQGWINRKDVLSIQFEDLRSRHNEDLIRTLISFYCEHSATQWNEDDLVEKSLKNINPKRSPTFREGKIGSWKTIFTKYHKKIMKQVAGQLLIDLGYENDFNW